MNRYEAIEAADSSNQQQGSHPNKTLIMAGEVYGRVRQLDIAPPVSFEDAHAAVTILYANAKVTEFIPNLAVHAFRVRARSSETEVFSNSPSSKKQAKPRPFQRAINFLLKR